MKYHICIHIIMYINIHKYHIHLAVPLPSWVPRAPGCQWLPWDCRGLPGKKCRAVILVVRKNWRMVRGRIQHISSLMCFFTCFFWQSQKKTNLFLLIAMSTPKKKKTLPWNSSSQDSASRKVGNPDTTAGAWVFPGELQKKVLRGVFQATTHLFIHTQERQTILSFFRQPMNVTSLKGEATKKGPYCCLGWIGDEMLHSYMGSINHEIRIQDPY